MYVNHFDLSRQAFQRVTEPDQYFRSEGFETTLHAFHEGIRSDCGLMLLTGESGVGKTAAVQLLERKLTGKTDFIAFDRRIFEIDETEADGSRIESPTVDRVEHLVFHRLVEASRRRPDSSVPMLAVVDDAHMGSSLDLMGLLWAAARLRAGANGNERPGLLLVGDADLEQRFRAGPLQGLEGDVKLQCRMAALSPEQIDRYIRFHLERAGYRGGELFSDAAIAFVEQYSEGIPQLINNICGMALVIAAEENVHQVTEAILRDAASDLLASRQTPESETQSAPQCFDGASGSATESNTYLVDIPERVEDLDPWLGELHAGLIVEETREDDIGSRALDSSVGWLRSRVIRVWGGADRIRQSLLRRIRSAQRTIGRWPRKSWRDARVEHRWGSYWIRISHGSEHAWAVVRRTYERLASSGSSVSTWMKTRWGKPLLDTKEPEKSTFVSAWTSKQAPLQVWKFGASIAFSSMMAVVAITIWTLVLTHNRSAEPEDERGPSDAVARLTETSASPVRTAQAQPRVARLQPAPIALEGASDEQILIALDALIDVQNMETHEILALTSHESRGVGKEDDRSAKASAPDRDRTGAILQKVTESEPSAIEISMAANMEIPPHTPKTPPAEDSDNRKTRISTDGQSPARTYVVARGDTLWDISRRHKMTINRLRQINNLSDKHVIQPGQSLRVDSATHQAPSSDAWHTVQSGENLFRIGRRYGISVAELKALNSLIDPSHLKVGQRLRIGAAAPANRQASEKHATMQTASQG